MFPAPTFAIWRIVVDLRVREQTGRPLADSPYSLRVLWCWYDYGVPARVVGDVVAWKMNRVARVTFARFYTDRRVDVVRAELMRTGTFRHGEVGDGARQSTT